MKLEIKELDRNLYEIKLPWKTRDRIKSVLLVAPVMVVTWYVTNRIIDNKQNTSDEE